MALYKCCIIIIIIIINRQTETNVNKSLLKSFIYIKRQKAVQKIKPTITKDTKIITSQYKSIEK